MLNPSQVTDAVVSTLASIPELAAAMTVMDANSDPTARITAFHFLLGADHRLAEAVYKMPAPSMLVVWDRDVGGNFNGYTICKHVIHVYFRMGNAAGLTDPVGYEDLWWIACNKPLQGNTQNIRYTNILPELDIMDTPSIAHMLDEDQIDIFRGEFVIPEIGDN